MWSVGGGDYSSVGRLPPLGRGGGGRGQVGVGDARAKGPRFFSKVIRLGKSESLPLFTLFLIFYQIKYTQLIGSLSREPCEVLDAKLGAREPPHLGQRCRYRGLVTYQGTPPPPARQTLCAALTYLLCSQRYFMSTAQVWLVRSLGRLQPSEPRAGGSGSITAVWISTLS